MYYFFYLLHFVNKAQWALKMGINNLCKIGYKLPQNQKRQHFLKKKKLRRAVEINTIKFVNLFRTLAFRVERTPPTKIIELKVVLSV